MTQNRPPASVQVRLAAVESSGYPLRALGRGYEASATGDKAICLTLTIGVLAAQVFGGPGAGNHGFQKAGGTSINFIGIYPPQLQAVAWPPHESLDDTSLTTFAHGAARTPAVALSPCLAALDLSALRSRAVRDCQAGTGAGTGDRHGQPGLGIQAYSRGIGRGRVQAGSAGDVADP
jgi:hypothetical protein